MVLGTWNIRNFDDNRFGHGPRNREALYYIAETISAFDVLAEQELTGNLKPLDDVIQLLGPNYDYIVTDVTEGPGGNRERLGFIYDKNKVWFKGVAGEIVLPFKQQISDVTRQRQFSRTPFTCYFQSGWFKFMFGTVHIYYGKPSKNSPEYARRVKEIDAIARFLAKRAKSEDANYVLVGDFNIEDFESDTFVNLEKHGFQVFKNRIGSNALKTKFYDQISFRTRPNELQLAERDPAHGVLDVFNNLYTEQQFPQFEKQVRATVTKRLKDAQADLKVATEKNQAKKIAKARKQIDGLTALLGNTADLKDYYIKEWRTFQLSDHLPLWVDLKIDFSGAYLESLKDWKPSAD